MVLDEEDTGETRLEADKLLGVELEEFVTTRVLSVDEVCPGALMLEVTTGVVPLEDGAVIIPVVLGRVTVAFPELDVAAEDAGVDKLGAEDWALDGAELDNAELGALEEDEFPTGLD